MALESRQAAHLLDENKYFVRTDYELACDCYMLLLTQNPKLLPPAHKVPDITHPHGGGRWGSDGEALSERAIKYAARTTRFNQQNK